MHTLIHAYTHTASATRGGGGGEDVQGHGGNGYPHDHPLAAVTRQDHHVCAPGEASVNFLDKDMQRSNHPALREKAAADVRDRS